MSTTRLEARQLGLTPHVVTAVVKDGAVLLNLETKYFYSVNATGWFILQFLENGATIEEIQAQCSACGAQTADSAIRRFIEALKSEDLVTETDCQVTKKDVRFNGSWTSPSLEKHKEPLHRIMTNAFDPSLPLSE